MLLVNLSQHISQHFRRIFWITNLVKGGGGGITRKPIPSDESICGWNCGEHWCLICHGISHFFRFSSLNSYWCWERFIECWNYYRVSNQHRLRLSGLLCSTTLINWKSIVQTLKNLLINSVSYKKTSDVTKLQCTFFKKSQFVGNQNLNLQQKHVQIGTWKIMLTYIFLYLPLPPPQRYKKNFFKLNNIYFSFWYQAMVALHILSFLDNGWQKIPKTRCYCQPCVTLMFVIKQSRRTRFMGVVYLNKFKEILDKQKKNRWF